MESKKLYILILYGKFSSFQDLFIMKSSEIFYILSESSQLSFEKEKC